MASLIGSRVERKEDKRFLTGKGQYTADINLVNQTFATFVRSPHARAQISKIDIGQSLVVSSRRILGIEGPEGTDNLIERCSEMPYEQKPIMVKLLKLNQDIRVDLPTIGMETIKLLSKHNFSGIAIQSYLTIILDQDKVIEFANKENIFIEAIWGFY